MDILTPKIDFVFREIFGSEQSENILSSFLKSALNLGEKEYSEITVIDPHLGREYDGDKWGILDIKLKTASGKIVNVEIQVLPLPEMRSRISYYQAKMLTGQISEGEKYGVLEQAICVVIVNFPLIHESEKYHTVFKMLEKDRHFPFNDLNEINVLDLTKIPVEDNSELANWLRFIRAETEEECKMASEGNAAINEAYLKLQVLSRDEAARMRAESRLKAQRDEWSRMDGAKRDGIQLGRSEGIELGQAKFIRNMINNGVDIKTISTMSGVSESEIERLIQQ
jgi:predicted transposase/invertase (TIGR01784 family)